MHNPCLKKVYILYLTATFYLAKVSCERMKYEVTWNPKITEKLSPSKIFYQDVKIGEYMDVICPQYDVDETNIMTFVIYNVTKEVFENCGKINEGAVKLLQCNQPSKRKKLTMKFQSYSPNPKGFIFYPDESYYLIAHGNGNKAGCEDKMRMRINVHPKRHHNHHRKTNKFTTVVRKSPKFLMNSNNIDTETSNDINVKHAETFKERSLNQSENYSIKMTSSSVLNFFSLISFLVLVLL